MYVQLNLQELTRLDYHALLGLRAAIGWNLSIH